MTTSTPAIGWKRYTAAAKTLETYGKDWDTIYFAITPDPQKAAIQRRLSKYETRDEWTGEFVDSERWNDSVISRWAKPKAVSPWTIWKMAGKDVCKVQIITTAPSEDGKWTLALLPKEDLQTLDKNRKDEKAADRRERKEQKAELRAQTRLQKEKRAQEAKALMAAINNASQPSKPPKVTARPQARSRASALSTVSQVSAAATNASPAVLASRSPRTSFSNGNHRSSIEKAKEPLVRCSTHGSSSSSVR